MLKLVRAMDAFVRVLVITVFTTGALQMAGIMKTPKSVYAYPQQRYYRPADGLTVSVHEVQRPAPSLHRQRQNTAVSMIDYLYDLPATTMKAFDEFVKKARPTFLKFRDMATKKLQEALSFGDVDRSTRLYRRNVAYHRHTHPNMQLKI